MKVTKRVVPKLIKSGLFQKYMKLLELKVYFYGLF